MWLITVFRIFQTLYFDGSLLQLFINCCYSNGMKQMPNHFLGIFGHYSNSITC